MPWPSHRPISILSDFLKSFYYLVSFRLLFFFSIFVFENEVNRTNIERLDHSTLLSEDDLWKQHAHIRCRSLLGANMAKIPLQYYVYWVNGRFSIPFSSYHSSCLNQTLSPFRSSSTCFADVSHSAFGSTANTFGCWISVSCGCAPLEWMSNTQYRLRSPSAIDFSN